MNGKVLAFVIPILSLLSMPPATAEITSGPDNASVPDPKSEWLWLVGEITAADVKALKDNPNIKAGRPINLTLNSQGGDWVAAMEIGKLLRGSRSMASVVRCLSSCVMVLAGAPRRVVTGGSIVGIHRPYWTSNAPLSQAEATEKYRAAENLTRSYLHDMNIPTALFDAMVRVPADDIHILQESEIAQFGLNSLDPVEAEMSDAAWARELGITRTEYLSRKRKADELCPFPKDLSMDDSSGNVAKITKNTECKLRVLRTGR